MQFDLSFLTDGNYAQLLWQGVQTTFRLFAGAWLLGFAVSLVLVCLRSVPFKPLQWLVAAFVEYHRNVPTVVQIMVWYFGMPQILPDGIRLWLNRGDTEFMFALIALALNVSGYMSEDIRSGLRAIPATQGEAARSVGLSAWGALRHVLVPQALRIGVPPLINRTLILFKDTSLAMVIGVAELTYQVKAIENLTFRSFEVFAASTALYLMASLALMALGAWFARRYPPAFRG
ncbi:ABC transporter permease [Bordetella genomosp. 1]|uniref:ABC transporter permease n=1 Tax=Bordetella genomosp. 1 TaxID=1395607 RepID=A0A261RTK1_9BORD|nr:amino acid ABC transporter permease [Bordetella genomosp. 1]MDQ8032154.1 amino acid ABC transporter permease [Bordetella sp.]OZI28265.1 ABC transporter permease [Bordetella genomosp. 1]